MNPGAFAAGVVTLAAMVVPLAVAARRVRRRWLPGAAGASAALVEAVTVLAQLYAVGYLLGSIGWFRRLPVVVACIVVGAAIAAVAGSRGAIGPPEADDVPESEPLPRWATWIALGLAALVVAQYGAHVLVSLGRGMYDGDTLWYHAPFASRFVQDGWITRLHFTHGEPLVTYFPANAELAGAFAILPFHRDTLLPFLNLGWLALGLLAGWCLGRPYRRAPLGLAAAAVAFSLPIMASTQGGTARNDAAGTALLLASAALLALHTAETRRETTPRTTASLQRSWWLVLSGIAGGLAFGVKLSLLPPATVLGVAVLVTAPRGRRLRTILPWAAGAAIPAAFWLVRNWARAGNPLPWIALHLGPVRFTAAPLPDAQVHSSSVLHYAGEPGAWRDVFSGGLRTAFGTTWPLLLAVAVTAAVAAIVAGRDRAARAAGATGLIGMLLYVATPNTAASRGMSVILVRATFFLNSRYAVPALAVALASVATSRLVARRSLALGAFGVLAALVVASQFPRALQSAYEWPLPAGDVVVALAAVAAIGAAVVASRRVDGRLRAGVAIGLAVALLWPAQRSLADHRYRQTPREIAVSAIFPWTRTITGSRIAIAGDFFQFPYYGPRLDNHVQYVGVPGPHGAFLKAKTCRQWRTELNKGRYDYVVVSPPPFNRIDAHQPEEGWIGDDPNATRVTQEGGVIAWRLHGPLDPARCA